VTEPVRTLEDPSHEESIAQDENDRKTENLHAGLLMAEGSYSGGEDIIQQPIFPSITLHLLPGVLTTLAYVITAPFPNSMGYPSNFAFLLTGLFVLIPFELGFVSADSSNSN